MKKCRHCRWLNFDFFRLRYESFQKPVCGIHGMCTVDLDSDKKENLNGRGSCSYEPKGRAVQLSLFD